SPALSYHASVVLQDRYLVLIGGWNGKSRTSDLNIYDGAQEKWLPCETHGFPIGSGLSSHTANLLSNGKILVVGREGFLKTQRRFASMFLISSNPERGEFIYK
ncbi:hypothetical protein HELRODRAFT_125934, partial [Helobdella robusta]|uniref:Uncharacterized protein n=1 Tax=Helobdella robusta TaxID=6412 RepID=T1EH76_HELRO